MRRFPLLAPLIVLVAALATGTTGHAAYFYSFDQTNYTVNAGGTVSVSVYLSETGTSNLTNIGLIEGDVRLLFNEPTRVSDPAQVISRVSNPAFDSPATPQPALVAATSSSSGIADIIQSSFTPVTAVNNRILLGTFVFQAGLTPGVVTQLRATDQNTSADGLVLTNGTVLDRITADGLATITVNATGAVPEIRLVVNGSQIIDDLGAAADVDGDGRVGGTQTVNFFRLFGDTDGDRDVDGSDFNIFRQAYLGQIPLVTYLDFNNNGTIVNDTADRDAFLARRGKRLTASGVTY